jgi:thioredoxin-dependent peroxiredoxin
VTESNRLSEGDLAPDFTLPDEHGRPVTLSSFRGGRVILYFYPAAMTPGCTTQACDFRDSLASLGAGGYRVLGVSPDDVDTLARFAENDGLEFPLLSDPDHAVLTAYGVWGEKTNYGRTYEGVIRSTFVIDEAGVLVHALYNVRATGHVAMLRKRLGLAA